MKKAGTIFSKILSRDELIKELNETISILRKHDMHKVKISFGFMWGETMLNGLTMMF